MKQNNSAIRSEMVLDQFVGESEWTRRIRDKVRQVAQHRYSVLVTGPSGTGKELVAKAIHLQTQHVCEGCQ